MHGVNEPSPIPFSDAVLDAYVKVIRLAYEANGDRIDPELGHNEGSFRYLIYQTVTYFLPGAMRQFEDVRIEQDNSVFVVRQGAFGLRAYPIGTSELDNPWTSFPSNRGGAPAAAAQNQIQMAMFPEATLHPENAGWGTEYILGHCGTSLTGLRAVHLCLPVGSTVDETVRQWASVHTIYRADADAGTLEWLPGSGPRPVAPIVIAPAPIVALRADDEQAADTD